jgi:hypothetical protein
MFVQEKKKKAHSESRYGLSLKYSSQLDEVKARGWKIILHVSLKAIRRPCVVWNCKFATLKAMNPIWKLLLFLYLLSLLRIYQLLDDRWSWSRRLVYSLENNWTRRRKLRMGVALGTSIAKCPSSFRFLEKLINKFLQCDINRVTYGIIRRHHRRHLEAYITISKLAIFQTQVYNLV